MKNTILLFFCFFIAPNYSYSQEINDKELNFKNSIEYSIEVSNNSINPLIEKINILLNDGDIENLSMEEYDNCKSTLKANRKFVAELAEIDNEISLKQKTIKYLETVDKILEDFILPIIEFINTPNQSEMYNSEKLHEGVLLIESSINETSNLSDSIDKFCTKYNLSRKMSDFKKEEYVKKIETLKK